MPKRRSEGDPGDGNQKKYQPAFSVNAQTWESLFSEKELKILKSRGERESLPNYQIDQRLKKGRDYPMALKTVTEFLNQLPFIVSDVRYMEREEKKPVEPFLKEWKLIEKSFHEYFFSKTARTNSVTRINRKIRLSPPALVPSGPEGEYNLGQDAILWVLLAEIISDRRVPKLIHSCDHCQKTFFSKKWERFHPECSKIFFTEKDGKTGKANQRTKASREKAKEKKENV